MIARTLQKKISLREVLRQGHYAPQNHEPRHRHHLFKLWKHFGFC